MADNVEVSAPSSDGLTDSERYLARLCRRSFLRLWSWPNVYRDQRAGAKTQGKEVCDLLAVFGRHVFIFSDKYCQFPRSPSLRTDWSRWYRRAVLDGAKQIWGAERWIKEHPERLFRDAACTARLPINLPPQSDAIFHRIVVAHGAGEACRSHFSGSGSLMLAPGIPGDLFPFTIGALDPQRGYVHVMDDVTLDIVLSTVDTVSDLADYLEAKERLIASGKLLHAAGEEEILAHYLKNTDSNGKHAFLIPDDVTTVTFDEGIWEAFQRRPERLRQIEANKPSYAWDVLIDEFAKHMLGGTHHYRSDHTVAELEMALRMMAAESRTDRRALAKALLSVLKRGQDHDRFTRVVTGRNGASGRVTNYVFMTLKRKPDHDPNKYRVVRHKLLAWCCMVCRMQYPTVTDVVGIATSPRNAEHSGEDLVYLDGSDWTPENDAEAKELQKKWGLLTNLRQTEFTETEYPPNDVNYAKGRNRNLACPCGSGRKVKKCDCPIGGAAR
jgi:hypothetical protein